MTLDALLSKQRKHNGTDSQIVIWVVSRINKPVKQKHSTANQNHDSVVLNTNR